MADKQEENRNKTRCKSCGSLQTYIKIEANERVCRKCGHIEKIKKQEK